MNQTINENLIKVSGKFPITKKVELGQDVVIVLKGGIYKKEVFDLQDGTINVVYVMKPTDLEVVEK